MRAALVEGPGQIRIANVEDPTPVADEVVVRVGACGVCGTDLHIADGTFPLSPYPIVPGHEFAGEVVALGAGVEGIRESARVVVDPLLFCGRCEFCRRGRGNLCNKLQAIGATVYGGFAEYVAVPAANVYVLPEEMTFREAALVEPLSCAVLGVRRLGAQVGDTFLIYGVGTMGLILLQLALRSGASRVCVVDRNPRRLELAERLGAVSAETSVEKLLEVEPLGFDCVIDATGVPTVIETAFQAVKPGGKLLIFGVAPEDAHISLSPYRIFQEEITVLGSMSLLFSFTPAIELLLGGALDTGAMLSDAYPLDAFADALGAVRGGEGVKTQVLPA